MLFFYCSFVCFLFYLFVLFSVGKWRFVCFSLYSFLFVSFLCGSDVCAFDCFLFLFLSKISRNILKSRTEVRLWDKFYWLNHLPALRKIIEQCVHSFFLNFDIVDCTKVALFYKRIINFLTWENLNENCAYLVWFQKKNTKGGDKHC